MLPFDGLPVRHFAVALWPGARQAHIKGPVTDCDVLAVHCTALHLVLVRCCAIRGPRQVGWMPLGVVGEKADDS